MQMDDLRGACHLVEVVDILGHNGDIIVLLKLSHEAMTLVGLHVPAFLAEHVIEVRHKRGVGLPSLVGGDFLHGIVLPQAIGIAESLQSMVVMGTGTWAV